MAKNKKRQLIRRILGWIIFTGIASGIGLYLYTREPTLDVTATPIKRGHIEQTIAAFSSGTVEPKLSSMIAAQTLGKVVAIPVKKGDRVQAGDILVVLESKMHELQVAQAETRLQQSELAATVLKNQYKNDQTRIQTLKRTRDIASLEFNKDKTLYEKENVGSESLVHLSEINYNQIEDTYQSLNHLLGLYPLRIAEAETGIKALELMVEQARLTREWAEVRAPFAGLVADIFVKIGESVGSGLGGSTSEGLLGAGAGVGTTMPGSPSLGTGSGGMNMASPMAVVHLVDDSDLYVKAPFDESAFGKIQIGQKVRIGIDAYPDEEFPGTVAFISSIVTRNLDRSRTFEVEILIEEGKEKLAPGISADAVIIADEKEDVLIVPTEALIREEEGYVIENGRAVRKQVSVGIGNWKEKEVLSGLREGDLLITSVSVKDLRDGVKVRVVESLEAR